jgi:hypothetical protein
VLNGPSCAYRAHGGGQGRDASPNREHTNGCKAKAMSAQIDTPTAARTTEDLDRSYRTDDRADSDRSDRSSTQIVQSAQDRQSAASAARGS